MKRFLMLAMLLVAFLAANAEEYTARQETLRTSIENSLRRKGYTVEKVDDGLKFISDGNTWYVEIDKKAENPMFVRLCRYIKFDDNVKREKMMENLMNLNRKYVIKAACKEKNLLVCADMFVSNGEQFMSVFDNIFPMAEEIVNNAYE